MNQNFFNSKLLEDWGIPRPIFSVLDFLTGGLSLETRLNISIVHSEACCICSHDTNQPFGKARIGKDMEQYKFYMILIDGVINICYIGDEYCLLE